MAHLGRINRDHAARLTTHDGNELTKTTNEKIEKHISQQVITNTKLDLFSGAINNHEIGDGSVKLQTYCYGHDVGAGKARALKVDSTGRLEVNCADIELHTGDISLSVDGLETLIGTTNTKLQSDLDFAGQPNSIGDGSNMKRTMTYGHDSSAGQQRPLKVDGDGHLQVDCLSTALPTGAATETTLAAAEVHLGNIDTGVDALEACVGTTTSAGPAKAVSIGGTYVDGTFREMKVDNIGKVIVDSPAGSDLCTRLDAIQTAVEVLDNAISGSEMQVDVVSMPTTTISGTVTANLSATDNAVLDAIATDGDNIQTKLDTLETTANAIQTAVEGTLTVGSHAVTNAGTFAVQAACSGTVTANLSATDNAVLDAIAADGDAIQTKLDTLETTANAIQTAVEGTLTVGSHAVTNAGTFAVQAACTGTVTANLSSTDNAVLDAIAADGDAIQTKLDTLETTANAIQTAVEGTLTVGSHAVTNAGTFAVQVNGDALTSLQLIDDVVKAEDSAHSNTDKGIACLAVRKDTQTQLAGSDADYGMLQTNATGALRVHNNKSYTAETSIISSQSVSGSGTHTTSSIANNANYESYLMERNFSGSDVSFEILESIDNSNFFNAMGTTFNDAGDPSAGTTGISNIEIKSPYFKVKFTNGNASSRDVTLSYVAITTQ